jgi:glycosyltransferase involved in cell wall biosynthesis
MFAFAKYLDKSLYDVEVITLDLPLLQHADPEDVLVHRLPNHPIIPKASFNKPGSVIWRRTRSLYNKIHAHCILLDYADWRRRALQLLEKKLKDAHNPVIISSFAPTDAHLIPLRLKQKGFQFIWIADFRDEMSLNPYHRRWSGRLKAIERSILSRIDGLTTISDVFIENFRSLSPRKDILFAEVRNGFDFDVPIPVTASASTSFRVNYFGSIYASVNMKPFYDAIDRINTEALMPELQIRLIGVGNSFRLPGRFSGFISKSDRIHQDLVLEQMSASDAFLFILPNIGWKGVYSGKLFEYLGCRRPIIALTDPEDVAANLIRDCKAGFIADPGNSGEIVEAFSAAYKNWKENRPLPYNDELINAHHRKNQVSVLNGLISRLSLR